MNAWIMLIDPLRTSVFRASTSKKELTFSTVIKNTGTFSSLEDTKKISDDFAHYIAEEIEIACGCGTNSALIISGDTNDVQKVCKCLSSSAKSNIIGIAPKGYNPELWKQILNYSQDNKASL